MRITLKQLRKLIDEAKIAASAEYMKKEAVREHVQKHLLDLVKRGEIKDQAELDAFWETTAMAVNALKGVPIGAWSKMAGKPVKKSA